MRTITRSFLVTLAGACVVPIGAAGVHAAEVAAIAESCNGCHGEDGVSSQGEVPTIAGLSAFVIEDYLLVFQDQARPCRASAFEGEAAAGGASDHCVLVEELSEKQIAALAEHYAAQKFVPAAQETDPAKAALGGKLHAEGCEQCHSDGGANADDDASILAGQWMPYLRQSLEDFNAGAREQPKSMQAKLKKLGPEQLEALVHYYGSQQ